MERNDIAVSLAQDALLDWFMQIYCSNFKEDPGVLDMAFRLPPEDAIEYLKSKGMKITWSWKDMEKEAHAKSFTVAKAMKTDILTSIKDHLQKALEEGWSFDRFQKTLAPEMQKKGWWGKVPDELVPSDGSIHAGGKIVQLGSAWRLKTIFATNVQSAMMAGRYKAMSATTATRPYWQYLAVMDASTRPDHARLHGRVFRHDDPIWQRIFPPNGFNCRCSVRSLSDRDLKNKGLNFSVEESKNGQIFDDKGQPIEPDPGFDYNPGLVGAEQLEAIAKAKQEQLQRDLARAKKTTEPAKPQSVSLRPTKPEEDVFVPVDKYGLDEEIPPQDVPSAKEWEARQTELKAKADAEAKAAMEKLQARLAEKAKKEEEAKAKAVVDKEKKKVQAIVRKMPNGKELDDLFDEIDLHDAEPTWNMDNVKGSPRYGGVVFNDKGQILLRRPTNDFDGYVWTFAKGGADGQKPLKAAKREVLEETGTEATTVGYLEGGFGPQKNNFFFVMKAGKHDPTKMDKETQDMKWVSPKEAVEHIMKTTNEKGRERDLKVLASAVRTWNGIASGKITYDHLNPEPDGFPASISGIEVVKTLGGSTGARLVKDKKGRQFVMKTGNSPDHLLEETYADAAYQAAGISVPKFKVYKDQSGNPVKLSEFMPETKSLQAVLNSKDEALKNDVLNQIRGGFVADALLGNWDVVGLGMDNILVDKNGKAWRIDNGGSLRFRAQGERKTDAQWNGTVSELKTLLDAGKNSTAAKVFKGVTENDIASQIKDLLDRQEEILQAVPQDLRPVMKKRFDYLKGMLDDGQNDQAAIVSPFTADFITKARAAKGTGLAMPWDDDQFEDAQILTWEELDKNGSPVTRVQCKLRPTTSSDVLKHLKDFLGDVPKTEPLKSSDPDYSTLLVASGNVAYHYNDKKYNASKLTPVVDLKAKLESGPQTPKAKAYIAIADEIIKAWQGGLPHTKISPTPPTFDDPKTKTAKGGVPGIASAKWGKLVFDQKEILPDGTLRQTAGITGRPWEGAVELNFDNGAKATHAPFRNTIGFAHQGLVTMTVPGNLSPETLAKASDALSAMGLKTGKASIGTQKVLAIAKTLSLRNWHDSVTAGIIEDTTATPEEKADRLLEYLEKKRGLRVRRDFDATLKQTASLGAGYGYQNRIDMTEEDIEKALPDAHLTHHSGNVVAFVESVVKAGGDITSTMERLRKGVSISSGMSPEADQQTGGASYFFTRITKKENGASLEFPIRLLARSDAISFAGDRFGKVTPGYESERYGDIEGYKFCRSRGSNETIFKHGLSIWDAARIRTKSQAERNRLLKFFKDQGYERWPDGRSLQEVIL